MTEGMPKLLATTALRLLACLAVAWGLWRLLGLIGLVVSAPLFGVMLARPILDLFAGLHGAAKAAAYAGLDGRHFEHRGVRIDIAEDERHQRWVSVADLRKLIPGLPRAAVLQRHFPDGIRDDPALRGPRISAEALLEYLAKSTDSGSLALRNWVEREVARPAAKIRQRLGIRDQPAESRPPDAA